MNSFDLKEKDTDTHMFMCAIHYFGTNKRDIVTCSDLFNFLLITYNYLQIRDRDLGRLGILD